MKKLLFLCAVFFMLFSCKDKYETEIEYAAVVPNTSQIITSKSKEVLDAKTDREAKILFAESAIRINNLGITKTEFLSGTLEKNGILIDSDLEQRTIDSLNAVGEKNHRNTNQTSKFNPYVQ